MRRAWNYFLWVIFVLIVVPQQSYALVSAVPTAYTGQVSPVIVTAYKATSKVNGKGDAAAYQLDTIDTLELYNTSDHLIDLSQWHIYDASGSTTDAPRELQFRSQFKGYIEPKSHVVLTRFVDGRPLIDGATYEIIGWSRDATTYEKTAALRLEGPGYRIGKVDLKYVNGTMQKRNIGVDGYLESFVEAQPAGTPRVDPFLTEQLFDDGLYQVSPEPIGLQIIEIYPYARDCAPFDEAVECRDFVKIYNAGKEAIPLDGYVLRTSSGGIDRSSTNTIHLNGVIQPGEYKTISYTDNDKGLSLTNSGGHVWFEDAYGASDYHSGLASYPSAGVGEQGQSYIYLGEHDWRWTTTPSPIGANNYTAPIEQIVTCPEGKYLNPETNRCRTIIDALSVLASCDEGYERNPLTNRCRKISSAAVSTVTPCKEGQERNPITNRCRSIATAVAELLPCDEGYERNPTTHRCRKIKTIDMPVMGYPVKPAGTSTQMTMTWWALGGVGALALMYAGWEWRTEAAQAIRRVVAIVHK